MPGLFEVRVGTELYYTDADGSYVIHGQLIDAKAKRADPNCAAARVDLSAARKEALFRQFEAEIGPAVPANTVVADPEPVPRCKQASK